MSFGEVSRSSWRKFATLSFAAVFMFAAIICLPNRSSAQAISEGFDDVTTLVPQGWAVRNNSLPLGTLSWIQGVDDPSTFTAFSGGPTSYIAVTYLSVAGSNTISNWLFAPNRTFSNGDQIRFYTRTVTGQEFPDRLQVRLSTNGSSIDVGTTATSVGDFSTLLLDINEFYGTEYPETWTQYTLTLSNLPGGTVSGRIAFRYFVQNGGPEGFNSDYIGIDDFEYIPAGVAASTQHVVDYNGDGKSDFPLVRNNGGNLDWYTSYAGVIPATFDQFGVTTDTSVAADFDGDQKTDMAVWRPGAPTVAQFLVMRSTTSTVDVIPFGQTGDNPNVTADYTGDGKADPAIYRGGVWWYIASSGPLAGTQVAVNWGIAADFPAPGDYDGDGIADFCVQRNLGGNQASFIMIKGTGTGATGTPTYTNWGTPSDVIVPGDYDGDGKADYAVVRAVGGQILWFIRTAAGDTMTYNWGLSATDFVLAGDYDGDGKSDPAVFRPSDSSPTASGFWVYQSTGAPYFLSWGLQGDYPVGNSLTN